MDARVDAAKTHLDSGLCTYCGETDTRADEVIADLVAFAEERERINVGLLTENAALKAKARQPEAVDLSSTSSADLLAELARRLES